MLHFYYHADVWHEAATYQLQAGSVDDACTVYERAIIALPRHPLLHFAYAELLETHKKIQVKGSRNEQQLSLYLMRHCGIGGKGGVPEAVKKYT